MALTGTYLRSLDEKKRLALPKRLRDDFGDPELTSLMVAPGTEKSLVVYSPQGFDAFAAKLASGASHQNYVRLFYSSAERVELDGQGRMRIPERLAEYAGLRKEAYLLGVQDHAELWDKEAWDSFVSRHTPAFDELALKAMGG